MAGEDYTFCTNPDSFLKELIQDISGRGHYNPRIIDFSHSMLLVIDVQNAFFDSSEASYIPSSQYILPKINDAVTFFDSFNLSVCLTRHSQGSPSIFFKSYIKEESHASQLYSGLIIPEDGRIIQKSSFSALYNTDLGQLIKDKGIQTVFICGVTAHLCVESTARSLVDMGIMVVVIADAVASWKENQHNRALHSLSDGIAMCGLWQEVKESICL